MRKTLCSFTLQQCSLEPSIALKQAKQRRRSAAMRSLRVSNAAPSTIRKRRAAAPLWLCFESILVHATRSVVYKCTSSCMVWLVILKRLLHPSISDRHVVLWDIASLSFVKLRFEISIDKFPCRGWVRVFGCAICYFVLFFGTRLRADVSGAFPLSAESLSTGGSFRLAGFCLISPVSRRLKKVGSTFS